MVPDTLVDLSAVRRCMYVCGDVVVVVVVVAVLGYYRSRGPI